MFTFRVTVVTFCVQSCACECLRHHCVKTFVVCFGGQVLSSEVVSCFVEVTVSFFFSFCFQMLPIALLTWRSVCVLWTYLSCMFSCPFFCQLVVAGSLHVLYQHSSFQSLAQSFCFQTDHLLLGKLHCLQCQSRLPSAFFLVCLDARTSTCLAFDQPADWFPCCHCWQVLRKHAATAAVTFRTK